MVVAVSTEASDSTSIAFSTHSRSSRTRSKISRAETAGPARSISIESSVYRFMFSGRKQPVEVRRREGGNRVRRSLPYFGELACSFHHHGRFIPFAAVRNGGEIRCVGLDQKAVGWCHAGGFAHVFSC